MQLAKMYAVIGDPQEAEDLYRRTLTEKEKMMLEDSMLGMDDTMCEYKQALLMPFICHTIGFYFLAHLV